MVQQAQIDLRHELYGRLSLEILGEMLAGAVEPDKLLVAALKQALHLVEAPRGLVFDQGEMLFTVGYSAEESQPLRQRLAPLLAGGGLRLYSAARFAELAPSGPSDLPESDKAAVGMAGVMEAPSGPVAALAVERNRPFTAAERRRLTEWLRLASVPVEAAVEVARAARLRDATKTLELTDLPLERLKTAPSLEQIERLVIAEAMRRTHHNKSRAAAILGITREGLRKKLLRLGM